MDMAAGPEIKTVSSFMMDWSENDGQSVPVHVTVPDRRALLADLAARLDEGTGFSIATLNLDHVLKLRQDAGFRAAYAAHSHVTADGNPIVWLARLAGQSGVSLVPGAELIDPVAALAAKKGVPVGLFGATTASLEAAAEALKSAHPGLVITFVDAPPMGFDPNGERADQAIAAIRESGARVIFLALGAPKQECFAARAQEMLSGVGFLSIGAGLDFVSGAQPRAPVWVRVIAMEWLWRLLSDPSRLAARYGACLAALPGLSWRALKARQKERPVR